MRIATKNDTILYIVRCSSFSKSGFESFVIKVLRSRSNIFKLLKHNGHNKR